ncbi:hypothetical protein CBR_g60053 [Chara braunii]|uniref:CCHC-type domain-containing protein n=1 Tax=Chara braunii TaxID=69332 RepID=A0A388K8N2_CHABU|nr:hypothetical protein CBR_g60053 [Chara braunii]|eukprot:GBG66400.1 hypothetical protein CBR_g60053 [Chara braunii]
MEGEVFDQNGRVINPEIPGGTREEALRIATLGPNAPGMFRIWQEKEEPIMQVEDVTNLEEKVSRMRIGEDKEDVPIVEGEAEEDDVRTNVRDAFDRMEDLVDKMQRLHLRRQEICRGAGREEAGCPKVFTMGRGGSGDGPNEPNPRMQRANMAARNSGSQRSIRGTIPFATRRPAGGNPQKEQAQASQPAEEEPPITVEGDEEEDEKIREEEERGGLKQGSKRRYKTVDKKSHPVPVLVSQEEGVYYNQERKLIQRMREGIQNGPCRIDEETEKELIIGEPGFLTRQEEDLVKELIREKHGAYAFNDDERGRLDVDKIEMIRIHTVPHKPWNVRGAKYPNPEDCRRVVEYLDGKIRTDVAGYSSGPYASPWFCFIKPNGVLRWVQDLERLNAVIVRDAGGLPNADQLSEACAGRSIVSLIDLYSGYDQFPVYPADRPITAMHTPRGLVHMNVAPQGWTNAVAMVQRSMIRVMQLISPQITEPYIDDLAIKGPIEKDESEVAPGVRRRDPWKEEAMAQRGAVAGPSGPALRKGGQRREQRISRNLEELPIYRAGASLRVFLRDLEGYAFMREWGDREKIANVRGAGMYKRRIEGVVAGWTRWRVCKVRLWRDMGEFPRNDMEDDLKFNGTNLEDFIESLQLAAERGEWSEEEKRKQLIADQTKADGDEQEEEEAAEERKRSMKVSMVPRKKKLGKKRAIKNERKEVQERVSEKEEGVEEAEERKEVQGGCKAPKIKRTKGKRPIGEKEETSEIGRKEDEKDGQVEKLMRDMEEMREEVKELKKEKEELQKEMSQLRATLNVRSRELENEVATRGKMKIRVDGLVSEVSVLGQDLDNEISERKKLGQEWEKRWEEILRGMEEFRLSQQREEKEATEMVGRKGGEEKGTQTEEKKEEPPAPEKGVSESVAMPLPGQGKRQTESQLDSPKVAEDQVETSIQPDIKRIKPSMIGQRCFFCTQEGHLRDECSILAIYIKEGKAKYDSHKRLVAGTGQTIPKIPEGGRVTLHRILRLRVDF